MNSRTAWIVLCVVAADLGFLIGYVAGTGAAHSKCELEVREHEAAFLALWDHRRARKVGDAMSDCDKCMRCRICGVSVEYESQIEACWPCFASKMSRESMIFGLSAGFGLGLAVSAIVLKVLS